MNEDKPLESLTPEELEKVEIVFAPGCFDNFEGTQEELDEFIAEFTRLVKSGEILEQSRPLDLEELAEEDPEFASAIASVLNDSDNRKLH